MIKGALVELIPAVNLAVPNVIVFQFNPETLRHSWHQGSSQELTPWPWGASPLAVAGMPSETFSFSLSMDVTDQMTDPDGNVVQDATDFGIYTRLSALELLVYPIVIADPTTGGAPGSTAGGNNRCATPAQLPTVLFVWGKNRIVPVRVTSLTVTEQLYDDKLNPTHAEAQLELRVLTPQDLAPLTGLAGVAAKAAYAYSQAFRVTRAAGAASSLGDAARAAIGLLHDATDPMGNHVLPG
jgi:hypothetical protein